LALPPPPTAAVAACPRRLPSPSAVIRGAAGHRRRCRPSAALPAIRGAAGHPRRCRRGAAGHPRRL